MNRLTSIGRSLFAIAVIGLGIDHFIFGKFIAGRPPAWPESLPGGLAWAYLTGIVFVVIGMAVLTGRKARLSAILAGALVFVWALLRHIPVVATTDFLSVAWTDASKALRFVGGALAVAATLPGIAVTAHALRFVNSRDGFLLAARICVGLTLIVNGSQHFIFTKFVASLIPEWFPGNAIFWTYFGGVALIAGGLGLFIPRTARLAALLSGLMVFSWFWIIHVPRTLLSESSAIAVFEALFTAGSLFVIAGFLYAKQPDLEPVTESFNGKRLRVAGPAAITVIFLCASPTAAADQTTDQEAIARAVARIRAATAAFQSLDKAVAKGYERNVVHCVEHPRDGGMGFHHQNTSLLDDRIELERPEILVYERLPNGDYRLNGVEYIVPFSARPTQHLQR